MGDCTPYWLAFSYVPGIGSTRINMLLDAFADLEQAWHADKAALRHAGLGSKTVESILRVRSGLDLEHACARLSELGIVLIPMHSTQYPAQLRQIQSPPASLFVKGILQKADAASVGVVGTRQASAYGVAATERIVTELGSRGLTIISGLAKGIDSIAHRAALEVGARTIAVMGSGVDRIYPAQHRQLANDICQQGALVSEYPPGRAPEAQHFPARNRIIAGMAKGVIVIEAAERSGALITAGFAADQGKEVFAVPGDITRKTSRGTNRLIQDGAHPLLDAGDVIEILGFATSNKVDEEQLDREVDGVQGALLELLRDEPAHIDAIYQRSGLPIQEIQSALSMLELQGRVKHLGGMHYLRVREESINYFVD